MSLKKVFTSLALSIVFLSGFSISASARTIDNNTVKPAQPFYYNSVDEYIPGNPYGHVHTNGGPLNVRRGPGTNYSIIGSLSNGESVARVGWNSDGEWSYVKYHVDGTNDSKVGWVSNDYLYQYGD